MPLSHLEALADTPLEVVVVEDHTLVREELVAFLNRPGLRVRGAEDGEMLDTLLRQRPADVLVVDVNLPGEDGLAICQRMREAFPEIGLVLLTARVMPTDKTAGYQSGADVYLTKPANVDELEAVLGNLARRIRRRVSNGLQLDVPRHKLSLATGLNAELTRLETRLLYELALAPDRMLSTELLLQRLDPRNDHLTLRDNLPVLISRLRQKITSGLGLPEVIKAVRGHGYQLTQVINVRA